MRIESVRGFIDSSSGFRYVITEVEHTDAKNKLITLYDNQFVASWYKNQFDWFNTQLRNSLPLLAGDLYVEEEDQSKKVFPIYQGKSYYPVKINAYMFSAQVVNFLLNVLEFFTGSTMCEYIQEEYFREFQQKIDQERRERFQEHEESSINKYLQELEQRLLKDLERFVVCSGVDEVRNYYNSRTINEFLTFQITGTKVQKRLEIQFFRDLQDKLKEKLKRLEKEHQEFSEDNISQLHCKINLENTQKFKKNIDLMLERTDKRIQQNFKASNKK